MDMDTVALTYLLRIGQTGLSEISTLEMDRTHTISDFLALAIRKDSKHLHDVLPDSAKVWKPRMPISTFQQFNTLVSSLPPSSELKTIAHPLKNDSTIETNLPDFHHYIIIDVPPTSSHLKPSTALHLPSPPPSPRVKPKLHSTFTTDTPMDTVLSHPLFISEGLNDFPSGGQVPVTLSHPAFGVFTDTAEGGEVGHDEAVFLAQLCGTLRNQPSEAKRFSTLRRMLGEWCGVEWKLACKSTDSWVSTVPSISLVLTHDTDMALSHLSMNAILRTIEPSAIPNSGLHIHMCGPYLMFSGVTYTSFEAVYSTLHSSPLQPSSAPAARIFLAIRAFLDTICKTPTSDARSLSFPYSLSSPSSSSKVVIDPTTLTRPFPTRLLFFARTPTNNEVCIKFTRTYSAPAHTFCSAHGHAPKLHAIERIPGGWYKVTMERVTMGAGWIPLQYISSKEGIKEHMLGFLSEMHDAGWVHGDLRAENIFVREGEEKGEFAFLDFDWAGREGETRYPWDVNTLGVRRPEGVRGGGLVKREDDVRMVERACEAAQEEGEDD